MNRRFQKIGIAFVLAFWLALSIGASSHFHRAETDPQHCAICHFYGSSHAVAIAVSVGVGLTWILSFFIRRTRVNPLNSFAIAAQSRGPPYSFA